VADPHGQPEQRVPDHQSGVVIGDVGELQLARGAVADRVDAAVRGLQLAVHSDAGAVVTHAGRFEIEPIDAWLAASRDQQMRALDCLGAALALHSYRDRAARMGDALDLDAAADDDALTLKLV